MQDLLGRLSTLHRPRILIRAARIGVQDYCRQRHLPKVLGYAQLPKVPIAILRLIELEQKLNHQRCADDPSYPIARHIEVLIALMGEAQFLRGNRSSGK